MPATARFADGGRRDTMIGAPILDILASVQQAAGAIGCAMAESNESGAAPLPAIEAIAHRGARRDKSRLVRRRGGVTPAKLRYARTLRPRPL